MALQLIGKHSSQMIPWGHHGRSAQQLKGNPWLLKGRYGNLTASQDPQGPMQQQLNNNIRAA